MKRPMISSRGGSRRWSRTVKEFTAVNPVCWLRFPRCTIRSQTIDHYYPQKTHPHLAEVPSNYRPACLYCNRARRATQPHEIDKLRDQLRSEFMERGKPPKALGFFR